jgi:hypothetical protein
VFAGTTKRRAWCSITSGNAGSILGCLTLLTPSFVACSFLDPALSEFASGPGRGGAGAAVGGSLPVSEAGTGSATTSGSGGSITDAGSVDDGGSAGTDSGTGGAAPAGGTAGADAGGGGASESIAGAGAGGTSTGGSPGAGGGSSIDLCKSGSNPTNLASGGTGVASIFFSAAEGPSMAFDDNANTKWFSGSGATTFYIEYQFGGGASHIVTAYAIMSATDVPTRDPAAWQFQGSNGPVWTTLDTRSAQSFANRSQTNCYSFSNATAYSLYRLNITAVNGATATQLAELMLFGT